MSDDSSPEAIAAMVTALRERYEWATNKHHPSVARWRDAAALLAQVGRERDAAIDAQADSINDARKEMSKLSSRAEVAERQLAEARAALSDVTEALDGYVNDYGSTPPDRPEFGMISKARALLSGETK